MLNSDERGFHSRTGVSLNSVPLPEFTFLVGNTASARVLPLFIWLMLTNPCS